MQRSLKQKVAAGAAVTVLLAGGAVAAVSATGQRNEPKGKTARVAADRSRSSDLATAAGYLGIRTTQLSNELQSGKTLAQIANASGGKSAEGLVEALVAAKKAHLADVSANLTRRVTAEINRVGGPRLGAPGTRHRSNGEQAGNRSGHALFAGPRTLGFAAASYLGLSAAQLQTDLQAGKTLAQVAEATPGKSQAGLIDALAKARKAKLAALVKAGKLTQAKQEKRLGHLDKRLQRIAERVFANSASAG